MNLVRHDPFELLNDLQRELSRVWGRSDLAGDNSNVVTSQWAPPVDIKETDGAFVIYADVPGVDPKSIDVTMENGMLTIRGERPAEQEEAGERYTRSERAHGVFYRRFTLPDSADPDKIQARDRYGVLEVTIGKRETAQPRRIAVAA